MYAHTKPSTVIEEQGTAIGGWPIKRGNGAAALAAQLNQLKQSKSAWRWFLVAVAEAEVEAHRV